MDFHGFSLRDCDPRLARIFLNLSAAHYPERLGTFFIVSAPTVFNTLWRAISAFIDPVTKQKVGGDRGISSTHSTQHCCCDWRRRRRRHDVGMLCWMPQRGGAAACVACLGLPSSHPHQLAHPATLRCAPWPCPPLPALLPLR